MPRGRSITAELLQTHLHSARAPSADVKARLREAAARDAADKRTEIERFLGDPPHALSALAQLRARPVVSSVSATVRPRFQAWSGNSSRQSREK